MYICLSDSSLIAFKITCSTCYSTVADGPPDVGSEFEIYPLSFLVTVARPSLISTLTLLLASISGS
jgi:hypothetical protein